MELILVLPILFLVLVAGIQFASVIAVDTTLSHASLEASRLSSLGCDTNQVSDRVDEFLAAHGLSLATGVRLVVEDDGGIVQSSGAGSLSSPTIGTPVDPDCVRSTLIVETNTTPIPNLLRDYCVDFAGKQFEHVSVAFVPQCECP